MMSTSLFLAAAVCLFGQDPVVLTEDEAVSMALRQNADLAALRMGVQAAASAPKGVGLLSSPQVRVGFTDLAGEFNDPENTRNNVGLSWSPPRIGELRLKSAMVATRTSEAAGDLAAAESRLAAETRLLYRTVAMLDEQIRLAEEAVRLRKRLLADTSEQVEAGVKTSMDRSMAEMALADARVIPAQYRSQRRLHLLRLLQRIGRAPADVTLQSTREWLELRAPSTDRASLVNQALAQRAELKSATARCAASNLALSSAKRELYPWFTTIQLIRRTSRLDTPGRWGFQLGIEIPVFRWKENGIATASAQLEQCRLRRRAMEAAIIAEVDEVLARMTAVATDLETHRKVIVELSGRQVDLATAQLAAGLADRLEPTLAQLRLISARQSFLTSLMELRALEIGLQQATGAV